MDAAFSDTSDSLVSRVELLNVRMQNLWQYSSFSSTRWGQLDDSSSFNSSSQSKAHLLKDPANTADRTGFPFNANWPLTCGAIPMATTFRNNGSSSTAFSAHCNNWDSLVLHRRGKCAWPSGPEAANWFIAPVSTRRSIVQYSLTASARLLAGEAIWSNSHTEDVPYL